MICRRSACLLSLSVLLGAAPALAVDSVTGTPVLTFVKKDGSAVTLSLADIESMQTVRYDTKTPWHDGAVTFEGVPLRALFKKAGIDRGIVRVEALNGYQTELPVQDAADHPVIMAYKRDGKYMSRREKGPLFIVYNYDSHPDLQTERYYTRSAWQVHKIIEQ